MIMIVDIFGVQSVAVIRWQRHSLEENMTTNNMLVELAWEIFNGPDWTSQLNKIVFGIVLFGTIIERRLLNNDKQFPLIFQAHHLPHLIIIPNEKECHAIYKSPTRWSLSPKEDSTNK